MPVKESTSDNDYDDYDNDKQDDNHDRSLADDDEKSL